MIGIHTLNLNEVIRALFYTNYFFFFSSRRRHTRFDCDWSSDVCSSDLKKQRRLRRALKARAHIRALAMARLSVHRTPRHIYAQVTDPVGAKVIAVASTLQEAVRQGLKNTGNVEAAKAVGRAIATRAKAAGVSKVAFDRSGFQFHGRVKALADAAREAGLEF